MNQTLPKLIGFIGISAALIFMLMGCGGEGAEREIVYFDDVTPTPILSTPTPTPIPATPTPPPFQTQTLRIAAGEQRSTSFSVESSRLSKGRWCFEYHVDLIQESSGNNLDLDTFLTLPTGEAVRHVTVDALNSPIQGKLYAEDAGRYAIVLDNRPSLFTSKTVNLKTRMFYPC